MEDSSTNPFIPQESEAIRQKVYEHQSPLGRIVKLSLIATIVVAVLVGAGLFFVIPRTTAVDQPARVKLADALQPPDQVLKRIDVGSELGFKLNYDNRVYGSYAEVGDQTAGSDTSAAVASGQTYENNDLRVLRAYNYIRIRPVESVESSRALATQPPQLELFATVTDKDLTTAAAIPENKGLSKLSLFVKQDSDKRVAKKVADDKTVVTIDATKPVSSTIGSIDYQKVRYTTTNDNHRISNVQYDDCYYTIQFDQPYSICISNVRPTNVSAASLVEQVFDSITFAQPSSTTTNQSTTDKKTTSYMYPLARLAQATTSDTSNTATDSTSSDTSESPLITITPSYYADESSLTSIATAQPSVVRVGTLYCSNLSLKYESGDTATTLTDACVGNVASGVFISKDGYVATTGHAIRSQKKAAINGYINFAPDQTQMIDRLQRILDYLLKAKIILQSDADYLISGAKLGDQEALAKIENIGSVIPDKFITPINEEYTYAIQPTDKPIVINRNDSNKPSFAYSDSVLSAKYVTSNYEADKSIQETFDSSTPSADVGLLKVSGDFPDVAIAVNEDVKANDTLNTVGYPAYTDSSLTIDKIRNLPIATTSVVDQAYKKDGGRLIQTNTPVLPGNDGAPVMDSKGQLIGFAVYGLSYCPDKLCFANGTVRSSSELSKLIKDNNIKLATGSVSAKNWTSGVNEYFRANYAAASDSFGSAGSAYPFNRWADPLQKLAATGKNSAKDTSLMNQLQIAMIVSLIVLVALTIVLTIAYIIHRRRISSLRVGHYGAADIASTTQPIAPPQYPQQQVQPTSVQSGETVAPMQYPSQIQPITVQPQQGTVPTNIPVQQQSSPPQTPQPEDPFYK
ncbi:MAG: divTM [Candidatus Saccharibacteria bacterium]|nr:divTM [Candidatus Saccharibacteria bacterium]